jgi:hypothetical protein
MEGIMSAYATLENRTTAAGPPLDGGSVHAMGAPTPGSGGAEAQQILALIQDAGPGELFKRLYARPDYRAVIDAYTQAMLRRFDDDPKAAEAFRELLVRYGLEVDERVLPAVVGAVVVAKWVAGGAAVGFTIGLVSGLLD